MPNRVEEHHQAEGSSRPPEVDRLTPRSRPIERNQDGAKNVLKNDDLEIPLKQLLTNAFVTSAFPPYGRFLPLGDLDKLVTRSRVHHELERVLHRSAFELAQQICGIKDLSDNRVTSRKKLFAIMVLINQVKSMAKMIEEGLFDNDLPFELDDCDDYFPILAIRRDGQLHTLGFCEDWRTRSHENFYDMQWIINAPYMNLQPYSERHGERRQPPHLVLHKRDVLPVTKCQAGSHDHFADVYKVQFHQDHHEVAHIDVSISYRNLAKPRL